MTGLRQAGKRTFVEHTRPNSGDQIGRRSIAAAVRGQFVLTGSANFLIMKRIGDPLAGRAYYLKLWPMTRREQLGLGACGIWDRFFKENAARWLDVFRAEE